MIFISFLLLIAPGMMTWLTVNYVLKREPDSFADALAKWLVNDLIILSGSYLVYIIRHGTTSLLSFSENFFGEGQGIYMTGFVLKYSLTAIILALILAAVTIAAVRIKQKK